MSWSKNVFSSMVSTVAWEDNGDLIITWAKGGRRSVYSGVPEDVAEQLAHAPSVGQMINSDVKNVYPHRYL
jgi:hypothetical protein